MEKVKLNMEEVWLLTPGGVALLLLAIMSSFGLFGVKVLIEKHKKLDAIQALGFVENIISGHIELVKLIPDAPKYLKSITWLIDEIQSGPMVTGVFVSFNGKPVLSTLPENVYKNLFKACFQGTEKDNNYYICKNSDKIKGMFLLVSVDTSFESALLKKNYLVDIWPVGYLSVHIRILLLECCVGIQKEKRT